MARAQRKTKINPDHPAFDLAQKKWQSSGLTDDHAKALGLRPLTGQEVEEALGGAICQPAGMLIPYFDLTGRPTEFFRIRYLEPPPGFAGLTEKPQRYAQPAKTLNEVYLPPILPASWADVAEDTDVTIYITEGEFKAAAGCSVGLATLGLGGVDVWRSTKRGIQLLPALCEIKWDNRNVVIVYDSDAATNINVVRAQRQLAHTLVAKGALPAVASLPAAKDGSKQGLDDFLLAHGDEALIALLQDAPMFPEADALWSLSEEVIYVRDPGFVIARESGQRMEPARFASHHFANRHYMETTIKNGALVSKKKPLAKRWIEWERRAEVQRVTYAPGKPQSDGDSFNVWPGWGCEPKKGDVSVWTELLDHIFAGHPAERKWFEQWCAYPLQKPGSKMYTYVLLWSIEHGTGKSFISYLLKAIYGKNGIEIDSEALKASFNAWAEHRQFVVGDEITAGEARMDRDKLKSLITRPEIRINQKFMPEYRIPDCINYLFNSNQPDAMFMEDRDRRGFIHRVPDEKLTRAFWDRADAWLNGTVPNSHKGPGPAALFHHLLQVDLDGFKATAEAPMTSAKEEMIRNGKSSLGMWIMHLKEDPTSALRPVGEKPAQTCDLYTARQLLRCFDPEAKGKVTEPGMGRELSRAQIQQVADGRVVRTAAGVFRLYAVRNTDTWLRAKPVEIAKHYNSYFGPNASKF